VLLQLILIQRTLCDNLEEEETFLNCVYLPNDCTVGRMRAIPIKCVSIRKGSDNNMRIATTTIQTTRWTPNIP